MSNGKGDARRPGDPAAYRCNFDRIFATPAPLDAATSRPPSVFIQPGSIVTFACGRCFEFVSGPEPVDGVLMRCPRCHAPGYFREVAPGVSGEACTWDGQPR